MITLGEMKNEARDSIEAFANEFNVRLNQEMDSMVVMMHTQINRAISSAISGRVIPEIRNIVSSRSSSGNRDTEASSSPNSQMDRENNPLLKTKFTKKYSLSAGDLRETRDCSPYKYYEEFSKVTKSPFTTNITELLVSYFFCKSAPFTLKVSNSVCMAITHVQ